MTPATEIQLSIIIVNYRSAPLIIENLHTLYQFNSNLSFEIIVVDNASDDDSEQIIKHSFPQVQWLQMGYNSGFARANNAGIKQSKGEVVLLLNPDIISIDDSITLCYQQLVEDNYVAAGVQLLDAEQRKQISGSRFVKWGLNHLLPIPYWGYFLRWAAYQGGATDPNIKESKRVEDVDWISGAFLMVKKEAIAKAGLLDEDFFLYAEEVEWCSRLKNEGPLCIYGNCQIIHLEGTTINKSQSLQEKGYYNLYDKKGLQLMVSNHLRVRKQYGVLAFLFLLLNYTWGWLVYLVADFSNKLLKFRDPFSNFKKIMAFGKNIVKLWALAPKIISNKPHFYKMF